MNLPQVLLHGMWKFLFKHWGKWWVNGQKSRAFWSVEQGSEHNFLFNCLLPSEIIKCLSERKYYVEAMRDQNCEKMKFWQWLQYVSLSFVVFNLLDSIIQLAPSDSRVRLSWVCCSESGRASAIVNCLSQGTDGDISSGCSLQNLDQHRRPG